MEKSLVEYISEMRDRLTNIEDGIDSLSLEEQGFLEIPIIKKAVKVAKQHTGIFDNFDEDVFNDIVMASCMFAMHHDDFNEFEIIPTYVKSKLGYDPHISDQHGPHGDTQQDFFNALETVLESEYRNAPYHIQTR